MDGSLLSPADRGRIDPFAVRPHIQHRRGKHELLPRARPRHRQAPEPAFGQGAEHLGPFLVQCPASLGPAELPRLERLFAALPEQWEYVLELRHPSFFEEPQRVEPLLARYRAGRVMFDSRPIYRGDTTHPEVLAARHRKPDVPLLDTVYNGIAYARVVLHPDDSQNGRWVAEWLDRCDAYLKAGHRLYFMMHCPNNQHCPLFAERFHEALRARLPELPALAPWPVPQQPALF